MTSQSRRVGNNTCIRRLNNSRVCLWGCRQAHLGARRAPRDRRTRHARRVARAAAAAAMQLASAFSRFAAPTDRAALYMYS